MVTKTLMSIILGSSLILNPAFGEEKNTPKNKIHKIVNLNNSDYDALRNKDKINISSNSDYGTKVYTTNSGLEKPEFYAIRTNRKVQLYYPPKK